MTVLHRFICLVPLSALILSVGCQERTDAERCEELKTWLDNRVREAPAECVGDEDCEVVWMRPDQPVAVSVPPEDPQLQRVVREYSDLCAARVYGENFDTLPVATGRLTAVCQPQIEDDFNAEGSAIERVTGRQCVLRGQVIRPEPIDAGSDDVSDGSAFCGCTADQQCGGTDRCLTCECYPDSACVRACQRVVACDALDALNLGASPATCVVLCDQSTASDVSGGSGDIDTDTTLVDCILESECTDLLRCRR